MTQATEDCKPQNAKKKKVASEVYFRVLSVLKIHLEQERR